MHKNQVYLSMHKLLYNISLKIFCEVPYFFVYICFKKAFLTSHHYFSMAHKTLYLQEVLFTKTYFGVSKT